MKILSHIKKILKIGQISLAGEKNTYNQSDMQSDPAEKHENIIPRKPGIKVSTPQAAVLYYSIESNKKESFLSGMKEATYKDINGEIEILNSKKKLLHIIVEKGDKEILDSFLQCLESLKDFRGLKNSEIKEKIKPLFEAKDSNHKNAFQIAAENKRLDILMPLLEYGRGIDSLEKAVEKKDLLAVDLMVQAGVRVEDVRKCVEEQRDILKKNNANSGARDKQDSITSGHPSNPTQPPANRAEGERSNNASHKTTSQDFNQVDYKTLRSNINPKPKKKSIS